MCFTIEIKLTEKIELMRWGLIPYWAKDEGHAAKIRSGTYNARSCNVILEYLNIFSLFFRIYGAKSLPY